MNILITISGCSGGNKGPQGIYTSFNRFAEDGRLSIINVETVPDDINANVKRVSDIAREALEKGNVYLLGYSMGGAVAALVAAELKQAGGANVKGLILLDTQTDGLHVLKGLKIPVLFYHGKEDQVFPLAQIKSMSRRCQGPKKIVVVEQLDHDLNLHHGKLKDLTTVLANDIFNEISRFFFSNTNQSVSDEPIVPKFLPGTKTFRSLLARLVNS